MIECTEWKGYEADILPRLWGLSELEVEKVSRQDRVHWNAECPCWTQAAFEKTTISILQSLSLDVLSASIPTSSAYYCGIWFRWQSGFSLHQRYIRGCRVVLRPLKVVNKQCQLSVRTSWRLRYNALMINSLNLRYSVEVWRAIYLGRLWLVIEDCDSWHRLLVWKSSGSDICLATAAVPRHVCASCDCRPRDAKNTVSNDCLWSENPPTPLRTILQVDSWHNLSSRYHDVLACTPRELLLSCRDRFLLSWQYGVIEPKISIFKGQTIIVITTVTTNCHNPYSEKTQQLLFPGPVESHLLNGAGCCFGSSSLLCTHDPITSICVAPYISPVPQTTTIKASTHLTRPHSLQTQAQEEICHTKYSMMNSRHKTPLPMALWHTSMELSTVSHDAKSDPDPRRC